MKTRECHGKLRLSSGNAISVRFEYKESEGSWRGQIRKATGEPLTPGEIYDVSLSGGLYGSIQLKDVARSQRAARFVGIGPLQKGKTIATITTIKS